MSALATISAIAVTLGGIGRLAATDPKRRRSFGLAPYQGNREVVLAMTAVFLPGVLLLAIGTGADFVAWLGAICVVGWGVAAVSPVRTARAAGWLVSLGTAVRRQLRAAGRLAAAASARLRQAGPPGAGAAPGRAAAGRLDDAALRRIAELEWRVAQLEVAQASNGRSDAPHAGADDRRGARLADFQGQRTADA